jgi:hypothetical protein
MQWHASHDVTMQFQVVHRGVPVGQVDLVPGDLVAGTLTPTPAIDALRDTLRAGSEALLAMGFFGASDATRTHPDGQALSAAAALRFDLFDSRGELTPTTFVNLIESQDGRVVVIARFGHAHATKPATRRESPRTDFDANDAAPDD